MTLARREAVDGAAKTAGELAAARAPLRLTDRKALCLYWMLKLRCCVLVFPGIPHVRVHTTRTSFKQQDWNGNTANKIADGLTRQEAQSSFFS